MNRWKPALAQLWRAEPAAPLVLYCLLVAAQLGYIHLIVRDLHQGVGFPFDDFTIVHPWWALLISVYLAFRIWLGGGISWSLLMIWGVFQVAASIGSAWGATGSPFTLGMLPFSAACLVLLFMPAVLERASRSSRLRVRPAARYGGNGLRPAPSNRHHVS